MRKQGGARAARPHHQTIPSVFVHGACACLHACACSCACGREDKRKQARGCVHRVRVSGSNMCICPSYVYGSRDARVRKVVAGEARRVMNMRVCARAGSRCGRKAFRGRSSPSPSSPHAPTQKLRYSRRLRNQRPNRRPPLWHKPLAVGEERRRLPRLPPALATPPLRLPLSFQAHKRNVPARLAPSISMLIARWERSRSI